MKCDYRNCRGEATHHPKICVPAKDVSIEGHKPLECIVGVAVCKKHARRFPVQEILKQPIPQNPSFSMRDMFEALAHGRRPPDFARAFITTVGIHTDEAQKFRTSAMMQNAACQSVSAIH